MAILSLGHSDHYTQPFLSTSLLTQHGLFIYVKCILKLLSNLTSQGTFKGVCLFKMPVVML